MEEEIDQFSVSTEDVYENKNRMDDMPICHEPVNCAGESESSALLGLFFYSILMFTVPLGGFVVVKHYLEENFRLGDMYNLLLPIIVAVFLVNLIIALYVFRAFREDSKDHSAKSRPIEERKKLE